MSADSMTPREREELALIEAQRAYYAQQSRWEPWKALAALVTSGAVFLGLVWAVATWESHRPQAVQIIAVPPLTVHLDKEPK